MSDLPQVGELVQITYEHGQTELASWDGKDWHNVAAEWIGGGFIASWCRVLVLPDTGELTDRVAAAHRDMPWDEWQAFAERDPVQADNYRQLVRGYVAAVLGAAIR